MPALRYLFREVPLHRVVAQTALIVVARWCPSFELKRALWRLAGAKVGNGTAIGFESTLDILFPRLVTVGADVTLGYNVTILAHEYLRGERRIGPVVIGDGATIGASTTLLPGVVVGAGATVSAHSLVNNDVPPGELWGGVPARKLRSAAAKPQGREPRAGGRA